jgi:integrase
MTRAQRKSGLLLVADDLKQLGYRLPSAGSLKPKHIAALISAWRSRRVSDATIKNRMGWVRWWAMKTGKPGLIPRDNAELGIAEKTTFKGPRAAATTLDKLADLPERMALAVRLQMAFGLRLEESLKFRPQIADKGSYVALQASWCKGGKSRVVPLSHDRQRDLLDDVHRVCGDGALIPVGTSYIRFRKQFEKTTLDAGITNVHKHRHWYACWRYRTLAKAQPPAEGGPTYQQLSVAERARLDAVRLQISQELGHNRIDVTDAYLGPRWGAKS